MYNLEGRLSYRITDIYDITVTRNCIGQLQFYRLSHSENLPSGSLKAHLDAELLFHHRRSFWWTPFHATSIVLKYNCSNTIMLEFTWLPVLKHPCFNPVSLGGLHQKGGRSARRCTRGRWGDGASPHAQHHDKTNTPDELVVFELRKTEGALCRCAIVLSIRVRSSWL